MAGNVNQMARLPAFEATWEDAKLLQEWFPTFHEDKVILLGSNVMTWQKQPVTITYAKRRQRERRNEAKTH